MNCTSTDIKELLPAYIAGELDRDAGTRVESHLAGCADCRQELDLLTLLSGEAVPDPGETFWQALPGKVRREVQERRQERTFGLSRLLEGFLLPRWAWAAAAAVLLVATTWFTVRPVPVEMAVVKGPAGSDLQEEYIDEPVTLADASSAELDAATQWARNQLQPIGEAMNDESSDAAESMLTDDLDRLSDSELERVYEALKKKEQELKERNRRTGKDLA